MTEGPTSRLVVDDLDFEVRASARRATVEITVDRGGELIISAPPEVPERVLVDFVREKKLWLYEKLAEKEARRPPVAAKELVSGEGFRYLGRSYRLQLVEAQDAALKLAGGRFRLRRDAIDDGRSHFIAWYTEHGRSWLEKRVAGWSARMQARPTRVDVRDLGFRWGSCGRAGGLNFHWATILLPPGVVDYVIVHELAHLAEPNHTPAFWGNVARALTDYEARKAWLAEHGRVYTAL